MIEGRSRFIIVLGMATMLVFGAIGTALAAKGGGHRAGGGGSISLVLLNSPDGEPHYGQSVTFSVATTATDKPWVELDCYTTGTNTLIYQDWRGFFDGSLTGQNFILGTSNAWQSGDADCTAWLVKYSKGWSKLTSTSFHVYA